MGQAGSVGHPYRSAHDDCNFFGGPSVGASGRVLVGGVTFDHSRCAVSAASRCKPLQYGAVGYSAFSRARRSVCLSSVVVLVPSLCISWLRSSVVCCCLPALSGPGSFCLPIPSLFGALVFIHDGCLGRRVFVFSVGPRPLVGVGCLVVSRVVVVGLSASPGELLMQSSGGIISRRSRVSDDARLVGRFGCVNRCHFG